MGMFSWFTQDNDDRIVAGPGPGEFQGPVYMLDNKGNVWQEDDYDGYGEFGGKDFYVLLAEMNPDAFDKSIIHAHTADEVKRVAAIELSFSGSAYLSPNLVSDKRTPWENRSPKSDPEQGFSDRYDDTDLYEDADSY